MSFRNSWLPREGFHADTLGGLLRSTVLNPTLLVPLLLFAKYTSKGRDFASEHASSYSAAKILAILGSIRVINGWLNRRALNNGANDRYDWSKEIVLITGGSDGIGKQMTLMFASRGIRVAVVDIQPPTYDLPPNVHFFECDITSTSAIDSTATEILTAMGSPTVLINNAGVCRGKPLLQNTDADLNLTFGVNTISHYKLARKFVPPMIARNHGMVVTVASSAAWVTAPRMTEYAASKAAALAFHEGLAAELVAVHKADKVRTVVVNQGYTRTRLFEGFDVSADAFFGPALHVETVAEAIVDQVLSGTSGQVIIPGFYKLMVAHTRSFPHWMQHQFRVGLGNLMTNWKGRQVVPFEEEKS